MSIFIRECGHSDETTRRTKHPRRCFTCRYQLLESRTTNAKANLTAPNPKDVLNSLNTNEGLERGNI